MSCFASNAVARYGGQPVSVAHRGKSIRWSMARISSSRISNSLRSSQICRSDNSAQPRVETPHDKPPGLRGAVINLQGHDRVQRFTTQEGAEIFHRERASIAPPVMRGAAEVTQERDVRQSTQG